MKNKVLKLMLALLMVVSTFVGNISVNAAPYNLHEEFATDWSYASGKTGQPTLMWVGNHSTWEQAVAADAEVWCVESNLKTQGTSSTLDTDVTVSDLGYTEEKFSDLALIAYFGYRVQKSKENYFLTQNLIWEQLGRISADGTIQHVVNANYPTRASQDAWQADILKKVEDFKKKPSFDNKTFTLNKGETLTLTDTNAVLSGLKIRNIAGGTATIDGNKLTITSTGTGDVRIQFKREVSIAQTRANFIAKTTGTDEYGRAWQAVSQLTSTDPYFANVNVTVTSGKIQIRKKQANSSADIWVGGAVYEILDKNNNVVETLTTKASDEWIVSNDLPLGTYTIKEKSSPAGYKLDTQTYNVTLTNDGQIESKTLTDEPYGFIQIRKLSSYDDSQVKGAVYQLFDKDGNSITYLTTKANEWVKSGELPLGTYTLKEVKAPDGYEIDTQTYEIKISNANQTESKTVYDAPFGYIQIRKKQAESSEDIWIGGAVYEILDKNNNVVETLTTKASDEWVKSKALPLGTYKIKEKIAPDGYTLDTQTYEIKISNANQTESKTLTDYKEGSVSIKKVDKETGKALEGVEFAISSNADMSEPFGKKKTNAEGIATFTRLNQGSVYYVQEVATLPGYVTDATIHKIWIDAENLNITKLISNQKAKGSVKILKSDVDTFEKLLGVEFIISDKADMSNVLDTVTTNEEGIAVFKDLLLGKYYIQEKEFNGYVLNDKIYEVEVKEHQEVVELEVKNKSIVAYFDKIDSTTKERVADVTLQVIEKSTGNVMDEWTTDGKNAHQIKNLYANVEYLLREIKVPTGYTKADDVPFVLTNDGQEITIIMENVPYTDFSKQDITNGKELEGAKLQVVNKETGEIVDEWISTDEPHRIQGLTTGVVYLMIEIIAPLGFEIAEQIEFIAGQQEIITMKDMPYTEFSKVDATTGVELEGAKLQIIDKETNEVVEEWTSTKEVHKVKGLTTGKTYILHEDLAPIGYEIANDIEFVAGSTVKVEMKDEPYMEFSKVDATTGTELEGAKLQIIDKETNEVVEEWTSTKEVHKVKGLTTGKTYILHEDLVPIGYEIANDIEFVAGAGEKVIMKDEPILITIEVNKVDLYTKELIKTSKFGFSLYADEACTQLIKSANGSKETGIATFEGLRYGTYYLKETQAPVGYILSTEVKKVVLDENTPLTGNVYTFIVPNTPAGGGGNRPQTGVDGNSLLYLGVALIVLVSGASVSYRLLKKDKKQ